MTNTYDPNRACHTMAMLDMTVLWLAELTHGSLPVAEAIGALIDARQTVEARLDDWMAGEYCRS